MKLAFTFDEYHQVVSGFAERLPAALSRTHLTSDLAIEAERLRILDSLSTRFTVAVVGQMKAGKSTLLNALLGRDLAPTGVVETTATVNWFRWDRGDLNGHFRVHWADGREEDFPLGDIREWLREERHAAATRWIDFFSASELLETVNLVDTPGTRSVVDTHEGAARSFLLDEQPAPDAFDAKTRDTGSRADAIVYVLNPVAKETDQSVLREFEANSRMPGSTLHNSLAVIQKWEHLGGDNWRTGSALREARRKCERLAAQLRGQVGVVLPTSGLLARRAMTLPVEGVWDPLAYLATKSDEGDFEILLEDAASFTSDDGLSRPLLSSVERSFLRGQLDWPVVRLAMAEARRESLTSGEELRRHIYTLSGVDELKRVLHETFFRKAGLIKANTVLRRAWVPCSVALARLQEDERVRGEEMARLDGVRARVAQVADASLRSELERFLGDAAQNLVRDVRTLRSTRVDLDQLREEVFKNFNALEKDLEGIAAVHASIGLPAADKSTFLGLFGERGTAIETRLGLDSSSPRGVSIECADRLLSAFQPKSTPGAKNSPLYKYACERLEQILDVLERG